MPRYTLSYPGLTKTTGNATGSIARGTSPGQFAIEVAQGNAALVDIGDLVLYEDGSEILRLRNCAFDDMTWNGSGEGATATITILDRRWRWVRGGGTISGHYNIPLGDGVVSGTEKSLLELLTLCFTALGESGVDYSQVPSIDVAVEVNWDYTRTKDALDGLLSTYGLDVVLLPDDRVKIVQLGTAGADLPDIRVMSYQGKYSGLAVPSSLGVVGAKTRWQMLLELIPVGLDLDGKWKAVNALSYTPAGGWGSVDPEYMLGLPTGVSSEEKKKRKLAMDTVFRCFRVAGPADANYATAEGLPQFPGQDDITFAWPWQFELGNTLLTSVSNGDGSVTYDPAEIRGVFWDEEYGLENTAPHTLYDGSWQIDAANQLVRFQKPMVKFSSDGQSYEFPELFLLTTFALIDDTLRSPYRYAAERNLTENGAGAHYRRHEDIELQYTVASSWSEANSRYERDSATNNLSDLDAVAEYYLNALQAEMVPADGEMRPIAGWIPVELDSEIAQVSYSWSNHVATTRCSKNSEHPSILPFKKDREIRASLDAEKAATGFRSRSGVGRGGA